jgi:hypothetical protein
MSLKNMTPEEYIEFCARMDKEQERSILMIKNKHLSPEREAAEIASLKENIARIKEAYKPT